MNANATTIKTTMGRNVGLGDERSEKAEAWKAWKKRCESTNPKRWWMYKVGDEGECPEEEQGDADGAVVDQ
jgi:hypothetical protein